ncbi:vomeronasal type-1 receptor 4-like [Suncus etruscus]|uniref:vomeronasal type-1 receptor 4-like n=1 Tax=Suncus etruscus TaxID=109475 RepID=UPI00210F6FB3|nr:vomeronasal type-1 receptor 4-like [Suncus etruscus]
MYVGSILDGRNDYCPLSEDSVCTKSTALKDVTVAVIILLEILLGALGNFSLLCHYLLLNCTEARVRTTDLILMHMTMSNFLLIASQGVPQALAIFGLKYFFTELGCDLLLYVLRVGRGMSIGTTCLLSVFQAIMISPMNSCWKDLKAKAPQYVTSSIALCWIYYMTANLFFPLHIFYVSNKWNMKNITKRVDFGFCSSTDVENVSGAAYSALIVFPEVVCSVLIVWTSGSMILFLYRHKQRLQHIHSSQVSSRSSAGSRATQRILVLVSAFVCFHTMTSILYMCLHLVDYDALLVNIANIISACFPAVSPFLVKKRVSMVFRVSFALLI